MKNIAIIPARGGSKRIARKNIKDFLGKPIIAYPLRVLLEMDLFHDVIVSSDDEEIMAIAKQYGASAPFKRPLELSDDYASTRDVIIHAAKTLGLEQEDHLCCVYPTSVFLRSQHIHEGYESLHQNFLFAMSVVAYDYPIWRSFKRLAQGGIEMLYQDTINTRSQDLATIYHDAAQFYCGSIKAWLGQTPLFGEKTYGVVFSQTQVQDIDTLEDWAIAEMKYRLCHES